MAQKIALFLIVVTTPWYHGQCQEQRLNRLAGESSPYLLQHAGNPVDWYPWGDEAMSKAKAEGKLIFLSIGYSACHWCHVMERESFSDQEIATYMNEHFVCIKVDREQRPDVDQIYLTAVQLTGGRAGWPLSVFLTPDAKPISGGSYFPPRDGDRNYPLGFLSILQRLATAWKTQSTEVTAHADRVTEALLASLKRTDDKTADQQATLLQSSIAKETLQNLHDQFDKEFGGFGATALTPNRPKFPEPSNLLFLLDCQQRAAFSALERTTAMEMLTKTLDGMFAGGIYDHIGGGFHRYSTDPYWRIPHFEKMLYDNAQLLSVYASAFELTKREDYRWLAEDISKFVIEEMTAPQGAFYASINADSDETEGAFYLWDEAQLQVLQPNDESERFYAVTYGLLETPNFENKTFVPQPRKPLLSLAQEQNVSFSQLMDKLAAPRSKLKAIRDKRSQPSIDNKIIASWNGLMIGALADAGRILKRPDLIKAARQAANFIIDEMRTQAGLLCRTHSASGPPLLGYLDDYANVIYGFCRLHEATAEKQWLDKAIELNERQHSLFEDSEHGGYFYTSLDHPNLIVRFKDPVDGALPSGNSITAVNLVYLFKQTNTLRMKQSLNRLLKSEAVLMSESPTACPLLVIGLQNWLSWPASDR